MSESDSEKTIQIISSSEELADKILVNKQELVALDKRSNETREAIREIERGNAQDKKVWITVGSMLVKMERDKAIKLLRNDAKQIHDQVNILQTEQRVLVNELRDIEMMSPYLGTHLKPLDRKEINALKANFPMV